MLQLRFIALVALVGQFSKTFGSTYIYQNEKDELLDYISGLREAVSPPASNMKKMIWSTKLANAASREVSYCRDDVTPVSGYGTLFHRYDERSAPSLKDFVIELVDFSQNYKKQMINADSSHIGCAKYLCQSGYFKLVHIMCQVFGQIYSNAPAYMEGESCSECDPAIYPRCERNQCVPKDNRLRELRNGVGAVLTEWEAQRMLELHNYERQIADPRPSDMLKLAWSDDLSKLALKWARKCDWRHPGNYSGDEPWRNTGQNLAAASGSPLTHALAQGWADEKHDYTFSTQYCVPGKQCGHYTAMVWAKTTHVGCAKFQCSNVHYLENAMYLVCQYYPAGNVGTLPLYKLGAGCSDCTSKYPHCDDGLCYNDKYGQGDIPATLTHTGVMANAANGPPAPEDAGEVVEAMNKIRQNVQPPAADMLKLSWSDALAQEAYRTACQTYRKREYGVATMIGTGNMPIVDLVGYWLGKGDNYDYGDNYCYDGSCYLYTNMIAAQTREVGCAKRRCGGEDKTRCFFNPRLDKGESPYRSGESCSECDSQHPYCEANLCSASGGSLIRRRSGGSRYDRQTTRSPWVPQTTTRSPWVPQTTTRSPWVPQTTTPAPAERSTYVKKRQGNYKMVCRAVYY